jgi:hypothetical protein
MKTIEIDASGCKTVKQFTPLLKQAIHAVEAIHGDSIGAFVDSIVFGVMSDLAPPYEIVVRGLKQGPVQVFVDELSNAIGQARVERRTRRAEDVPVSIRRG